LAVSGDTISVAAATYTENLTMPFSLSVLGSGATTTIIDGGSIRTVVTVSSSSASVTLSGTTIRNGRGFVGGAGIWNIGTLRVLNSTVSAQCIELCSALGGGIFNHTGGTVTIRNNTISGNLLYISCTKGGCSALGGGMFNQGRLAVINSTLSGNIIQFKGFVGARGGGIYNYNGTVTINSSTVSRNSLGGGIAGSGAALQNSIVANNSGANCYGTVTSKGYDMSSDSSCNFSGPGDLNNTDPMLGPLQNNGGPTQTMALPSGSPAIDAGNPTGCTDGLGHLLKTDQRGFPRPDTEDTSGCDMGAYERQSD
jgi:hypothetical protein